MYNSSTIFLTEGKMKKLLLLSLFLMFGSQTLAAGDVAKGKLTSYTCTGCHGIKFYMNAFPSYHVPRLGGQNEAYIVSALKAYRSGDRSHPTMQAQAGSLSDQDIADIAAYFSSLK
jgi:cytochrome c553